STVQGRLATVRKDGGIHLSPIWFVWKVDDQRLYMVFGADRLHLTNFRADPRCTFMVDEDYRGEKQDIRAGAWAIVMRGRAELTEDAAAIEFVLKGIMGKALGAEMEDHPSTQEYVAGALAEGRVVAIVTPERWVAWDYRKVLPPPE